ncbi:tetratricopeptide repeat protein [Streptomyces sp. NPDC006193]|uniref:tetratricopeptide repeat protein n=1 Tax=Streptomyces sp. NPDC006193 TaxID=3155717 RepID=UPI0033A0C5D6
MPDAGRSILFAQQQNSVLMAEAREMSMAFADFSYLRWITGEQDPDRAWQMYFDRTQPQVRWLLDGLLATFPPEERGRAVEMAGSVEAFCLPSPAVESRVLENPGEATGHLIGISPVVVQLSGEIAWGMSTAHPYAPEVLPDGWEAATMHAQESLDLVVSRYVRALEGIGEAGPPLSMLVLATERSGRKRGGPRDYYDAAMAFALTHELAHIRNGDLLPAENRRAAALISERLAPHLGISSEENEELAADASTFTACFNYFLSVWAMANKPPARHRPLRRLWWRGQFGLTAWHSARRATEACEAYYSAVAILADLTLRRGDDDSARRLMTTALRLPYIQMYVQRMREETLASSYGPFMWSERDVAYRKACHRWCVHFLDDVMPGISRHQRPNAGDWPDLKHPVDLMQDPRFFAAAAAEWEERVAELERERGPDHPDTLSTRAGLAHLRWQAEERAGAMAALEDLVADMEQARGADDPATFVVRHNLAWMRGQTGDTAGAAAAFAELLADQRRVLGPDHAETLDTRYELAWLRGESGDAAGAAAAFAALRADHERTLGPDHTATLATRKSLAHWRERAGDAAGAAAVRAELRADQEPVLSADHPGTLAAYEARLAEQERTLGPGAPDTLTTRWFLAVLRGRAGDAAGAAAAYAGLLEHDLEPLGFDEVDLRVIRDNVAYWRGRAAGGTATDG